MSLVCRRDALAIRTTRSHWSEVIPALGEEDADGDDDEDEGGEKEEEAKGLAHHHRRPPLPLLPAQLRLAPLAQSERAAQHLSWSRWRRKRSAVREVGVRGACL